MTTPAPSKSGQGSESSNITKSIMDVEEGDTELSLVVVEWNKRKATNAAELTAKEGVKRLRQAGISSVHDVYILSGDKLIETVGPTFNVPYLCTDFRNSLLSCIPDPLKRENDVDGRKIIFHSGKFDLAICLAV
jgi:hypothetical protein